MKDKILLVLNFIVGYEAIRNCFFSLVEIPKVLSVEFSVDYNLFFILVLFINLGISYIYFYSILFTKKLSSLFVNFSVLIGSYILIGVVNYKIGSWLNGLEEESLNTALEPNFLNIYSNYFCFIIVLLSLAFIYLIQQKKE